MKTMTLRRRNGMEHLTMRVLVRSLSLFMHCRCDSMEDLPEEPIFSAAITMRCSDRSLPSSPCRSGSSS